MAVDQRLIHHHMNPNNTEVHFLSSHTFGNTQLKTIKSMHGNCKIVYKPERYFTYDEWKKTILELVHDQKITGIYIVIKTEWREKFINNYVMKGKVNGALIGWFIGFGGKDDLKHVTQSMTYIWKGCLLKFKIEETFGRAPIVRCYSKKNILKEPKMTRPVKTEQRRKR